VNNIPCRRTNNIHALELSTAFKTILLTKHRCARNDLCQQPVLIAMTIQFCLQIEVGSCLAFFSHTFIMAKHKIINRSPKNKVHRMELVETRNRRGSRIYRAQQVKTESGPSSVTSTRPSSPSKISHSPSKRRRLTSPDPQSVETPLAFHFAEQVNVKKRHRVTKVECRH
jgi:hypothetical protein